MKQKLYAVIPKHNFARLTKLYQIINQITIGDEDKVRVSGWVMLEGDFTEAEMAEVLELGGKLFDSSGAYHEWKTLLTSGNLHEEEYKPLQVIVPMPDKDGYARNVRNIGTFQAGTEIAEMVLYVQVRSYLKGEEQTLLRREAHLVAKNDVRIPLPDGTVIGEYDYLLAAINQASDLRQVITSVLQQRSQDGTIERRLT